MRRQNLLALCLLTSFSLLGCRPEGAEEKGPDSTETPAVVESTPTPVLAPVATPRRDWTEEAAHSALRAANPDYTGTASFGIVEGEIIAVEARACGLVDISPIGRMEPRALDLAENPLSNLEPLRGVALLELYLEQTPVSDLGPLEGAPLTKLYVSNCPVEDIAPLRGAPLEEFNAIGTGISDLSPLEGMPLRMLWLTGAPVSDISPLASLSFLESLTIPQTSVVSIAPLANSGLQRLHIAETLVTDLSPVASMSLTRLIFSPSRIEQGLDVVRSAPFLRELGVSFEGRMPPGTFWDEYDRGAFE